MKTAVVYWSMTGNTEQMAQAVKEGAGESCDIFEVSSANAQDISNYDAIALGCPAMGDEVLDEGEFEPFFEELLPLIKGKKVALFGSYDWGDGQWMRDWQDKCKNNGVNLVSDGIIANLEPDDEMLEQLKSLGNSLAN
ncbi:MAG: flavodoxin [Sphaerochaetaceae bacterium]|nr:flavodoxin [Sphaerochaetaceae bacterium]MDC7237139.1 flavodoxin [Sphaerochaetaceae bacterium]MDC7250687.1 flavodoxin [Sphaerochaetaceae bacterium]